MQVLRQSLTNAIQRPVILVRSSAVINQIRFNGSDPRSSTSPDKHKSGKQTDSSKGSDLNKTKSGDKKQKPTTTDDTQQPGVSRKDWNKPDQVVGNDPQYGRGTNVTDSRNPSKGN